MSQWKPGQSMFISSYATGGTLAAAAPAANPAAAPAPGRAIDGEWRRWIAENILLAREPYTIIQTMIREGFDADTASREVGTALEHPYVRAARQVGTGGGGANLENRVKKRDWLLEIYRRSARQATTFGQVPRAAKPSRQEFLDNYYALNRPVVITGAMDNWPALTAWTSENLKRRFGDRVVEVQANRETDANYEMNSTKLKKEMKFGDYVDTIEAAGSTNNYYMTANNSGKNKDALRELWDDIVVFPEYLRNDDPNNRGFFWFGPQGTVTPYHHDLTNNFMAQVRGRKLVKLVAPYDSAYMYNHRHCFSEVNPDKVDADKHPLYREATVIDVVIGPGDLLFLPIGWWHYVRGLDISITMTFTNFVFDNDFFSFYKTYQDV